MVVPTYTVNRAEEETTVWTKPGPRHSLKGPTWATGSLPTSMQACYLDPCILRAREGAEISQAARPVQTP
jgi:hypothetical protein